MTEHDYRKRLEQAQAAAGWTKGPNGEWIDDGRPRAAPHSPSDASDNPLWAMYEAMKNGAGGTNGQPRQAPTLDPLALHGVLGRVVTTLRPHTEACDASLLVTLAVHVGNYIGRGPHLMVESDRHGVALFAGLVGQSARARKGTAAGRVQALMGHVDRERLWFDNAVAGGFGSGEGIIAQLANDTRRDHRLLVDERELAQLLTIANREGSILSGVVRNGWDGQPLRRRVKAETMLATDYHLSAVGHITREELERKLTSTEVANGFGNRWLWVHAYRARRLPHGGSLDDATLAALGKQLAAALTLTERISQVTLTDAAKVRWEVLYDVIGDGELPGICGALTNRAEAYVLRLALLYAVLDGGSRQIGLDHLEAAWALWRYCDESVQYIFGALTGDPDVDRLVAAVRRTNGAGLTLNDAHEMVFAKHKAVAPIAARAIRLGVLRSVKQQTSGRPVEVLYLPEDDPR